MGAPYAEIGSDCEAPGKIMPVTNAIESLNARLRKIIKTRGHFPSDDAASKLIWLALEKHHGRLGPSGVQLEGGDEPVRDTLGGAVHACCVQWRAPRVIGRVGA